MKHKKLLLVTLSLILVFVLASCDLIHQCGFGEEWKFDAENHWHECECGKQDKAGAHAFGEWVEGESERTRECKVCGFKETAALEAHEHDYSDKWSKDGENHWHACSGCNVPADKAVHEWGDGEVITPATEEAEGLMKFTCSVCETTKEEVIPKLEHKHQFSEEWTFDETHHWHAATCSHEEVEGKEEHIWGEGVIKSPATEEADGLMVYTCGTCGATKEEAIPMLNHTHKFSEEWTFDETHHWHAATCIHTGEVDGKEEHDWNDGVETLAPTCSAVGTKTFTCTTCGATKTEDIPKVAHTEEVLSAIAPSCTEKGLTEGKKCSVCGETLVAQEEVAANGHSKSEEWLKDESNHWQVCSVCGEKSELAAHSFDTGSIVENKIVYTCLCGYTTENAWDGETVSESLSGSGTEADPYLIQSGADLAYIKNHMTAEGDNFAGVYFKMSKSIDLGNHSMRIGQYPGWNANRRFFAGIFDGNNCAIINLNMTESGMGGGLFAVVSGTVKNLSVYGKVNGDNMMVGGIVGWLFNGTLENCNGYVDVISTGAGETGALVGTSENGKIINCVNYGSVVGVDSVGGIAGKASGTIENCVNNGTVNGCYNVGGIYGSQHHSGMPTLTNNTDNGTAEMKHALTHYEAKENTCEEAGNIEYYACSRCKKNFDADGNVLGAVEIAAKGHAWNDGVLAEGKITFTCGNCGATRVEDAKYTVTVNHLFIDGSVAAEADAIEFDYKELATINAKTIEGYVANNDYVKVEVLDNVTITIYYSELSEAWDGTSVTESLAALGGSGTADDPYIIDSGADLALIDQSMTVAGDNYKGVYFKMTKSIDLGGNPMNIGAYTTGWNNDRRFFTGIFDGNNCSVRNLDLDMTPSGHMGGGLFAVVKGTVKNLSVYGTVKAVKNMSAGIVGWLYNGTLENCTNYVQVTSTGVESGAVVGTSEWGTIKNCVNYGSIVGTDSVGAIAGKASGTLTGCVNYGSVKGCTNLGGIYGSVHSSGTPTLTDCVDNGTISAHDLTYHEAKANSCEAAGSVEYYSCSVCGGNYDAEGNKLTTVEIAATGHAWDEGALSEGIITFTCGNCGGTKTENAVYTITVNHMYLDGSVAAEADTFEYGYNEAYTVYAKSIEGYAASHDYVMGTALDNQTVTIYYSELDTWDGTSVSTSLSGSGTEEDPYLIQSAADLAYFAMVINEHNVDGTFTKDHTSREVYTVYTGVYFKLTKSIDLNGNLLKIGYSLAWNKYSRFGGTFDGNNCSIRGISITSDDADRNDALFGMAYGGAIKNLSTYGSVYGGSVLNGGVVGYVVSATVENCTSYVNIEGAKETGGIVGNLEKGTVINCVNYGKVICGDTTTAGVIVGKNANGTITNCVSFTELNAE